MMTTETNTATTLEPAWLRIKRAGCAFYVAIPFGKSEPELRTVKVVQASAKQIKLAQYIPGGGCVLWVGTDGAPHHSDLGGGDRPAVFATEEEALAEYNERAIANVERARKALAEAERIAAWAGKAVRS